VAYGSGFIIALFQTGGLYYVDPANNVTEVVVPLGELSLADGLEMVTEDDGSKTLYVTEGANQISVFTVSMADGATAPTAELLGVLTSEYYDTAATSAVVGDTLWTANLGNTSALPAEGESDTTTFNTTFTVVGVSRFVEMGGTPPTAPSPTVVTPPSPGMEGTPSTPSTTSGAFVNQKTIEVGIVSALLFVVL